MSKGARKASRVQSPPETNWSAASYFGRHKADLLIFLGLVLSILVVYAQVGSFSFVEYDDNVYVYQNAHVLAGLTLDSVKWAFTAVKGVDYWRPVSLLSH